MPQESTQSPKQNRILAALTPNDYARLQDDLECVSMKLGQVLYEPGDNVAYAYFPTTCIVSLMFTTCKGASAELAVTGNDGLVGIPLVLGGNTTTHRAVIQSEGIAYRLKMEVMRWELDQGGELQHLCLRYTQALMTQMAQSVVCNRHHTVDQQLCRWLLLSLDRLPGNQLNMTQELIGHMLGVRREAVTEAAGKLQAAGLIQYSRGHISILDRTGLEERACECYAVVKSEYDRLFQFPLAIRIKNRVRPNPETMRRRAEARLLQSPPDILQTSWDNMRLVHELQVHQIELEMHNEELRLAYNEADALIERYADIYDFAPVSYFTLDREGVIIDMNLAGSILLSIKGSQKGRYRFASRIAPEDLVDFNAFFEQVFRAKDKTAGEFVLSANDHRPEAIVKIEAVPDEDGNECRMVVIDVSQARQAQKTLQERQQYLRAVIDNFPFFVWLKDAQSSFLAVNAPFSANYGWPSADALIGKTDFDITTRELAEFYREEDRAVLESGQTKTLVELINTGDGERWFEVYKSPIHLEGQAIGTVGFARDITERYTAEQALKNSEKRYRSLIEKMPLSVAILQDGVLKYINSRGLDLIGYPASECIGQSFLPLVHEADRQWVTDIHKVHALGELENSSAEVRLVNMAGRVIDCLIHVSSVEWEGRVAVLAILEDITAKKLIDAELHRLACIDPLTELASRQHFLDHMEQAFSRLKRGIDREVVVVRLDLDQFQTTTESLGGLAGDALLRLFSAQLRDELRKVDFAGRIDSEKFVVLLPETNLFAAKVFAERLREKVAGTTIIMAGQPVSSTISIGLAAMNVDDASADHALLRAEQALAHAHEAGGNRTAEA